MTRTITWEQIQPCCGMASPDYSGDSYCRLLRTQEACPSCGNITGTSRHCRHDDCPLWKRWACPDPLPEADNPGD